MADRPDRHHSWNGGQALEKAIQELLPDAIFPIRSRHTHGKHQSIFSLESMVHSH
jgi:hypothetical protein